MLHNRFLISNVGADTAENGLPKVWEHFEDNIMMTSEEKGRRSKWPRCTTGSASRTARRVRTQANGPNTKRKGPLDRKI